MNGIRALDVFTLYSSTFVLYIFPAHNFSWLQISVRLNDNRTTSISPIEYNSVMVREQRLRNKDTDPPNTAVEIM